MDRERAELKREIIKELLFDRLYRCIIIEDGATKFDKYELDNADLLYMLRQYDPEKVETIEEILRGGNNG